MYVVVVFVLALLSPLPFASPFVLLSDHIVQDATFQSSIQHIFFGTPPFEITSNLTISPFGIIQNGTNGFDSIKSPVRVNTFKIDNFIYAGVFGEYSNSFTIVNITDPSSPSQVSVLDSTVNSMFAITEVAYTVIDGFTYVISTSRYDDRVLIINISNPSLPSLVTYVADGANYTELEDPFHVTTVTIDSSTYALVAAFDDDGVQIIDITDPSNPTPVSAITDGEGGYTELDGAYDITTVTIDSLTFALVTAFNDNGIQIIDITDPSNPTPVFAITDGEGGYTELDGAHTITTVTTDSSTFALVTAHFDDGIQIIHLVL